MLFGNMLFIEIRKYIQNVIQEFDLISDERKDLLKTFAEYISQKINAGEEVNLTFICTHNSRRSQFAQVWAKTSAFYYGIKNIGFYSGGTEVTAFNLRAVNALRKAGFKIEKKDESENPVYIVGYSDITDPINCFSKVYNSEFNPQENFAAIMTCSDADKNCPVVFGAEKRFPIRYEDPKKYDGSALEELKYAETCKIIAGEMLYAFSMVKL